MRWDQLLETNGGLPVVISSNLRVQVRQDPSLPVQISRWKKKGRLIQLKKGIYLIQNIYRRCIPFEPYLANLLVSPSYLSLEKALEFHGLIHERVPVLSSVTTKLPKVFQTSVGIFRYHHIHPRLFWGYITIEKNGQTAFIAQPEKALLDLVYLRSPEPLNEILEGLSLQNFQHLRVKTLLQMATKFKKPFMAREAEKIAQFIQTKQLAEKTDERPRA